MLWVSTMITTKKKKKKSYILIFFFILYSRYDTHNHSLSDFPAEGVDREVFPGQDYSNPRVKDFASGKCTSIFCLFLIILNFFYY